MSIDGSFDSRFELERLISRCPKLGEVSKFTSLLKEGNELNEDEMVNAISSVFLHSSYTIPIMGCFRAISQKIVNRVVELLKLVPQLRFDYPGGLSNSMDDRFAMGCEELDDIEFHGVIEVYTRIRRFMDLHEVTTLAFCRVLDLAPFLKRAVESYFEFGGPPFVRILKSPVIFNLQSQVARHLRNIVWTSYRLLLLDPEYSLSHWNWGCFLDFVHQLGTFDTCDDEVVKDITWCGVQILSVLLRLPNRTSSCFGMQPAEVLNCITRWYEFCWDVSIEKAGWYVSRKELLEYSNGCTANEDCMLVDASKLLELGRSEQCRQQRTRNCFLLTSSIKKSFERIILAVNQKWPILLYGPAGSGKTSLINKLAEESGCQVISIHMDEQIDGRTLVGTYVCTDQPGEFRWQPGPLTQAVRNGLWVVFENIDQAASDVQSILLPLLEGGSSFKTGYGEDIKVADGFRLFSTISTSKVDICYQTEGKSAQSALWRRVMVKPPTSNDLVNIVTAWYPDLESIAINLTETFESLLRVSTDSFTPDYSSSANRFSLRDLLKWCKRIVASGFNFCAEGLSADVRTRIYLEAVDIFAAYAASPEKRRNIARSISDMWRVPLQVAESFYSLNKPVIQNLSGAVQIGRVTLQVKEEAVRHEKRPLVQIRSSFNVLERIACAVKWNEPVLLVGETGTGKTTLVQSLATKLGQKLTVLNLSQQSDVADLLGGFKPMDPQYTCIPLYKEFETLFMCTFSKKNNEKFWAYLNEQVKKKNWVTLLKGFQKGFQRVVELDRCETGSKRKRPLEKRLLLLWESFSLKVEIACKQIASTSGMIFSFVEGAFVTALRNGEWILLDEVNLAPPETLQRIIGVLDGENGSLCLAENGVVVDRHPQFRMFACMNPATDAGKRDLPSSLRSRFTEFFVDDVLEDDDLALFVNQFLDDNRSDKDLVNRIVRFYKEAKKESEERLQDGANQKPQFSLRSLYRALEYIREARKFGFQRALYDGFCMFFMTLLDERSAELMNEKIMTYLIGVDNKLPSPIQLNRLLKGKERPGSEQFLSDYVITKSVEEHIRSLARAAFIKRYPVLLQGPTSSGKTSLVQYLAAKTGHEFVRINNHEHTDLQEYLGSYITDVTGRLVFHEGVLVKAVRYGYWIVLDELNLAPSDVLEALNRLLDDNRELYVPELGETVRAHPEFMLFATQNPPTFYGGRKMLSRAFRNRFVEIHVDEIPEVELIEILERKCKIPRSYAKKMIEVMKELQLRRQNSKIFAGKHGFITPRDLFRWANRFRRDGSSYEDLARDGYYLLAERLRNDSEKSVVQEVLEKHLRVKLKIDELYNQAPDKLNLSSDISGKIVWTKTMRRLYYLVERCYQLKEPVLLVGETGGGKTTVCQLLSMALNMKLHILNCHQYTETSDFIGGFYPLRERSRLASDYKDLIAELLLSKAFICFPRDIKISSDIGEAPSSLNQLEEIVNNYKRSFISQFDVSEQDICHFEKLKADLAQLYQKWQTIFMWQDGPLVQAMKNGDLFLVDEISLADDSVLERLNSVLEPDRKLSLAEKGGPDLEIVTAIDNFFIFATMNPGGDYGKKELSPALRNRFTEIWVPPVGDVDELRDIAIRFLKPELHQFVDPLLNFWKWFNEQQTGRILTVRDLLAWLDFVTKTEESLRPNFSFLHGAFLILLDGLSLGTGIPKNEAAELRARCLAFLMNQIKLQHEDHLADADLKQLMGNYGWSDVSEAALSSEHEGMQCDNLFGIHPFYIEKGGEHLEEKGFEFLAPTTRRNVLRVLRAMQLPKPVLLEGSPGIGKTSLITAIGKFSGHKVVRINLSEQTDIMDLLGSDLPVDSEEGLQFAWSDGILLQALKEGSWVLLDEINLAQQSVLEGLNAILDHRAEVFIPELGQSFKCPPSFRVFSCQNPSCQGGGRKGLPKSFLNRFTKVYVDELSEDDYHYICGSLFPTIPKSILAQLILFNKRLYEETMINHKFAQDGCPWEFNLRDVIRSCQMIEGSSEKAKSDCFLNAIYMQRMRTGADRREVLHLYEEVFKRKASINPYPRVQLDENYLYVGHSRIRRNPFQSIKTVSSSELKILPGMRNTLEAAVQCIQKQWLCILVGPTSSGKTSLARLLAHLTGNVLNEINLSSATDISELLGSFEQYSAHRNFLSLFAQVERYVNEYFRMQLDSFGNDFCRDRKDLITKWLSFSSMVSFGYMSRSDSIDRENWRTSLFLVTEIVEFLRLETERSMHSFSWSLEDLSKVLSKVRKLEELQSGGPVPVRFEWASGPLIKAIENGEWIVLEDANLCNPTVLDRINSLVESNGSITVNECGNVDGKPLVLFPHPNFRMFLTVNPRYGDVSRAMRNRGIEIAMMPPYWLLHEDEKKNQAIELDDVKRFLALSNIPSAELVDSMAKAHIHAKNEGLRLDVQISYLELGRWIHLFQQLLMSGNELLWSLHLSLEHSYLSSLGEYAGRDIVHEAKVSYLTKFSSLSLTKHVAEASEGELSLCLPGGWPAPINLRDFIWDSNETSIRQIFMFVEYLGVECASFELTNTQNQRFKTSVCSDRPVSIYLSNVKNLQAVMYPKGLTDMVLEKEFDYGLMNRKLLYAAGWTIDQILEQSQLDSYLLWFSWFDSQLQPYCNVFGSLVDLLREEFTHPIWQCIFECRREMILHQNDVDDNLVSVPILALESVDVLENISISSAKRLCNAINSVKLLRDSLWQWKSEIVRDIHDRSLESVMKSLRKLEEEVLSMIVESPEFDTLYQIYANLLEEHILFWNILSSSQYEKLMVHWRALIKVVLKLGELFPQPVKALLRNMDVMSMNLSRRSVYSLKSEKSLLWAHGGHPTLPHSADIFYKLQQLVGFINVVWPSNMNLQKQAGHNCVVEVSLSTNTDLCSLATQGMCMTSLLGKHDEVESISEKLEEMYEMLLRRYENEKKKMEHIASETKGHCSVNPYCCRISPETMCDRFVLDSWLEILPMADNTSLLLDLNILQDMSAIVHADARELKKVSSLHDDLQYSFQYSINFSSRPPLNLVAHQEILWTLDAWASSNSVTGGEKVTGSVLDMWFKWHASLWNRCSISTKDPEQDVCEFVLPDMLVKPVRTNIVQHILRTGSVMKDYHLHKFKLRVASSVIWRSIAPNVDLFTSFIRAARSLLQQIIYAHKKSFSPDKFAIIHSFFVSLQTNGFKQFDDIKSLLALLRHSKHERFVSLIDSFIDQILNDLTDLHSPDESLYHISCAWLRLGGLRFHLLIACDDLDPAVKYNTKYMKLMERRESLAVEKEVRQHCNYLSGSLSTKKSDEQRERLLEKLESECKRLQRKIVFRSDPGKFIKLKDECINFSENVNLALRLLKETDVLTNLPSMTQRAKNWQATANVFLERLSEEYSSYADIIQPIQVAIYEMKLGMSLLISNCLQKDLLSRIQETKVDPVMDAVHSFMKFPCGYPCERQVQINISDAEVPFYTIDFSPFVWEKKMDLLKKLLVVTEVKSVQLEASLMEDMLGHVVNLVSDTNLLSDKCFAILDEAFGHFTSLWMDVKVLEESKKDTEAQVYKFRPRAFTLDDVCEVDLTSLSHTFSNESFAEWKELTQDEESSQKVKESEDEAERSGNWNLIPDLVLNKMVNVHNQLFGSSNLSASPGIVHVSDKDKLHSFVKSYTLGATVIKDLAGLSSSCLDSKLVAEHMLRLCLEHEQNLPCSTRQSFYKDANPSVVSGMVPLLNALRQRVLVLLRERDEHTGLQKILEVTEMLLALPSSTSVAQALSGLQFLVNRLKVLQENGVKCPLNDELEPILSLISTFQKMEYQSWSTVLDEVHLQFETNAAKLWFPLYSVLRRGKATDIVEYAQSTLQSLDELVRTSNLGEFRRRLQLILSFYGQLDTGIRLGLYGSCMQESRDILYHIFGFYVQYLPIIMDHIETSTKNIRREFEELLKLCQWERPEKLVSIENSKRNRLKLKKIIQKYTDALQQPVMPVLTQESAGKVLKHCSLSQMISMDANSDTSQFEDITRTTWYATWQKRFGDTMQFGHSGGRLEARNVDEDSTLKPLTYKEEWSKVWRKLVKIGRAVVESADIWKNEGKSLVKARAFTDLLKLMETSGLLKYKSSISKHLENSRLFSSKPTLLDDQLKASQSSWWFFLPSYEVQHLIFVDGNLTSQIDAAAIGDCKNSNITSVEEHWKTANRSYFKSFVSVRHLQQVSLNFHKNFTPDQVNRSNSFVEHLLMIQMEQRAAGYDFYVYLKQTRERVERFKKLSSDLDSCTEETTSGSIIPPSQHLYRCMWQQKELLDTFCSLLDEESLMLKTIESTHLSSCQTIKATAKELLLIVENFIPLFRNSKAFLDDALFGGEPGIKVVALMSPIVISKETRHSISENFQLIKKLQEQFFAVRGQHMNRRSFEDIILSHFEDMFEKAKEMEDELYSSDMSKAPSYNDDVPLLESEISTSVDIMFKLVTNGLKNIGTYRTENVFDETSLEKITSWKLLFESYTSDLQLHLLHKELDKIIFSAGKMANNWVTSSKASVQFKQLEELLDLVLAFSDSLLNDYLAVHEMVCVLTCRVAEAFASLFGEGFGVPSEDQDDDTRGDMTQDASGTGMGEGDGMKDVSDQITDEDQLLGNSGEREEQEGLNECPSKNEKGIEMEENFDAPTYSVSEDSNDENDDDDKSGDDEDEQVDSAMGNTGDDSEVVDEKLWDKEEDENLATPNEKYESGPSVKDGDQSNRELKAKGDDSATLSDDEKPNESDENNNMDEGINDGFDDEDQMEETNIDKDEGIADHEGLDIDEPNRNSVEDAEEMEVDPNNPMEQGEAEESDDMNDGDGEDDTTDANDEILEKTDSDPAIERCEDDDNSEKKDEGGENGEKSVPNKDVCEEGNSDSLTDHVPNTMEKPSQTMNDAQKADPRSTTQEMKWSMMNTDAHNELSSSENANQVEVMLGSSNGDITKDQKTKSQVPQNDASSFPKDQPNPLRDLGDALQDWKERVKVSSDVPETANETVDEMVDEDEDADEYGFTSEIEKGTAQALGSALPEQSEHGIGNDKPEGDDVGPHDEENKSDSHDQNTDAEPVPSRPVFRSQIEEKMKISDSHDDVGIRDSEEVHGNGNDDSRKSLDSLVSIKNSYVEHNMQPPMEILNTGDEPHKLRKLAQQFSDMKVNAGALWRKYELQTTRLSQELAEQLRLVMEPTLASKLQGDYRTGKRINMKKVIPYIASHYRKDKIWLRRTKPNKRDYQVVIAVDDSRSMSENCCGEFAIEALVTVCRALSQLEVGKLAVASFGKQGNIQLLHDFDQPFTGEAGMKMVSNFTFNQENTLRDEPVVDLLKFLNNMVERAVANARLPSGQNPLQQLVLVIADGRFHDNKEKVKRYIRDVLNRNCMVAFIVLDSADESIVDCKDYIFKNGLLEKAAPYLDSFPFPYYIVLRNIEALPRTLADLLRQWFELMQNSRD